MAEETIPQMRERIDKLTDENKDLKSQLESKDSEIRVRDAREAFRKAGYNPKHGDLYAKDNPEGEITPDDVASYAEEWDLHPVETESESTDSTQEDSSQGGDGSTSEADDGSDALSSLNRSGSRSGQGGGGSSDDKTYTRQEWAELNRTDPVKAAAALNQGRVETSGSPNARSGQDLGRGDNPYVSQHAEV